MNSPAARPVVSLIERRGGGRQMIDSELREDIDGLLERIVQLKDSL